MSRYRFEDDDLDADIATGAGETLMSELRLRKDRAHQVYKLADGTKVPGITTVLGVLNKPALMKWANNLGLEGIDSSKYVDTLANVGTLVHDMVEADLAGTVVDTSEYSQKEIATAGVCMTKYREWHAGHRIDLLDYELQMVSEQHRFGGTLDIYARVDGKRALLDLKTGKAIYDEMILQLAGLRHLSEASGRMVEQQIILRIGRNEKEGFEARLVVLRSEHLEMVVHCVRVYELRRELFAGQA